MVPKLLCDKDVGGASLWNRYTIDVSESVTRQNECRVVRPAHTGTLFSLDAHRRA